MVMKLQNLTINLRSISVIIILLYLRMQYFKIHSIFTAHLFTPCKWLKGFWRKKLAVALWRRIALHLIAPSLISFYWAFEGWRGTCRGNGFVGCPDVEFEWFVTDARVYTWEEIWNWSQFRIVAMRLLWFIALYTIEFTHS